jgi:proteasome lid subunit RPN8/RPN11
MSKRMLKISEALLSRIGAHGSETYPHECCGALLGRDGDAGREVLQLLPLSNRRDDSPRNRFELAPEDVRVAEKTARESGLELLGWYHSHPEAPARPSEFDRAHAWPWYSYIIVSVRAGEPADIGSWRLQDDRAAYDSEPIQMVPASDALSGRRGHSYSVPRTERAEQDECLLG